MYKRYYKVVYEANERALFSINKLCGIIELSASAGSLPASMGGKYANPKDSRRKARASLKTMLEMRRETTV
jgi:hypothetical protein